MRIVNANWTMSTPNDENVHKIGNIMTCLLLRVLKVVKKRQKNNFKILRQLFIIRIIYNKSLLILVYILSRFSRAVLESTKTLHDMGNLF